MSTAEENIKVFCRFRPQNKAERQSNGFVCFSLLNDGTSAILTSTGQSFSFDKVFGWDCPQREVYTYAAKPVIHSILLGYNGTVFAYGQTSSGKTHTMEGDLNDPELQGVIPRMVFSIFDGIFNADESVEFVVKISIVEIYNEKIKDLLDPEKDNLKVHEDKARGVFIGGVTELYVGSEREIFDALHAGRYNRSQAVTNMNEQSSRSHLVFTLTVEQKNLHDMSMKISRLHLVDLAGSECIAKSGVSGDRLEEAKNINRSLSALGNVINALSDRKKHIPYRDSKLTRMLQESLGGNAKTSLVITCSPSTFNMQETLSTLRFGQRAKMIRNVARVNVERSVEELKLMLEKKDQALAESQGRISMLESLLEGQKIEVPTLIRASSTGDTNGNCVSELLGQLEEQRMKLKESTEMASELHRERGDMEGQLQAANEDLLKLHSKVQELEMERENNSYYASEMQEEIAELRAALNGFRDGGSLMMNGSKTMMSSSSGGFPSPRQGLYLVSRRGSSSSDAVSQASMTKPSTKAKLDKMERQILQLAKMYKVITEQKQETDKSMTRKDSRILHLEKYAAEMRQKYDKLLRQVEIAGGGKIPRILNVPPSHAITAISSPPRNRVEPSESAGSSPPRKSMILRPRKSVIVRPMRGGVSFKLDLDSAT